MENSIDLPVEIQAMVKNCIGQRDAAQQRASMTLEIAKHYQLQLQTMLIAYAYGKELTPADWKLDDTGTMLIKSKDDSNESIGSV